jgi:hypothetical protein
MKLTLIVLVSCLLSTSAYSQTDSGIFLTIKCGKKMQRESVLLTGKHVCLAAQPIILPEEFETVAQVKQENELIYMDLTISDKAVIKMRQLAQNLPESTFALVVNKEVFQVFATADISINRTFRFEGGINHQADFFQVQEHLKILISGGTE